MTDVVVSVRVDASIHNQMTANDDINWSAVVRKAIVEKLSSTHLIDRDRARKAVLLMDNLRRQDAFRGGRNSMELIREWRQKRR